MAKVTPNWTFEGEAVILFILRVSVVVLRTSIQR